MGCFVVTEFLLTTASRGPSAIVEPLVLANGVQRIKTHEHVKFWQNRSIGYEYTKIFQFLPRDSYAKRGICHHLVSVCLCVGVSVRPSVRPSANNATRYILNGMFCSYRISTDKLSRGPSAIAEPLALLESGHTQTHGYTKSHIMPLNHPTHKLATAGVGDNSKKIVDSKLRPWCTTHTM